MELNRELIEKTEEFLKRTFSQSRYLQGDPAGAEYRLHHSYRVANIGRMIAEKEGFDQTEMVIACLLHDVSYCEEFRTKEEKLGHGRLSARIARPFLQELGLPPGRIEEICYGIAIHVDDKADFEGERTAFAETVSDADNIDRFDAYRIYENLQYAGFDKLSFEEKTKKVNSTLESLAKLRNIRFATETAIEIWQQRIDYYISFYERLERQLSNSTAIILCGI